MATINKEATITLRLDQELKEQIQQIAEQEDLSISHIIRKAIRQYLKNQKTII